MSKFLPPHNATFMFIKAGAAIVPFPYLLTAVCCFQHLTLRMSIFNPVFWNDLGNIL